MEKETIKLENIEKQISSQLNGETFEEYLNKSKLYYYEKDDENLKKDMKAKMIISLFLLICLAIIATAHIFAFIFNKGFELILLIPDCFMFVSFVFLIIVFSQQKAKQPSKCFWNFENTTLFIINDGENKFIKKETYKGAAYILLMILKILSIVSIIGSFCAYYLTNFVIDKYFWVTIAPNVSLIILNIVFLTTKKPHQYFDFLIGDKNSYIEYPNVL